MFGVSAKATLKRVDAIFCPVGSRIGLTSSIFGRFEIVTNDATVHYKDGIWHVDTAVAVFVILERDPSF